MECPKCGSEMILLLDSHVCDNCDDANSRAEIPSPCVEITNKKEAEEEFRQEYECVFVTDEENKEPYNHDKDEDLVVLKGAYGYEFKDWDGCWFRKSDAVFSWPGRTAGTMYRTKTGKYVLVYDHGSNNMYSPKDAARWFNENKYKLPDDVAKTLDPAKQI